MYRVIFITFALLLATSVSAEDCVTCHEKETSGAVSDWKLSKHFEEEVSCDDCHGDGHSSATDLEKVWWADRVTILMALGVPDPEGNPTACLDLVRDAQVARLSADEFDKERAKMVTVCANCHSENFAKEELAKGDQLIEKIDHLMAEAIREIVSLYKEGLLKKPGVRPGFFLIHEATYWSG